MRKNCLLPCFLLLVMGLMLSCKPEASISPQPLDLEWSNGWVRAMPPNAGMTAAYGEIRNNSQTTITLSQFSSDSFGMASLHYSSMENGVSRMTEQGNVELAAGESLLLEPGGLHLMLMKSTRSLQEDDNVLVTVGDGVTQYGFVLPVAAR